MYAVAVLTLIAWAPSLSMRHRTTLLEVMLAQAAVIGVIQGIVHVTRAERRGAGRFESSATTDLLTELRNRRAAEDHLEREVERATRYGRSLSLIWFDLDRCKEVNDRFGHAARDQVLSALATSLRLDLREHDCWRGGAGRSSW